jgi:hypothetical protein
MIIFDTPSISPHPSFTQSPSPIESESASPIVSKSPFVSLSPRATPTCSFVTCVSGIPTGGGSYEGCTFTNRAGGSSSSMSKEVTVINCTFKNIDGGSKQGGAMRTSSNIFAYDTKWIGCIGDVGSGIALKPESSFGLFVRCTFESCQRQTNRTSVKDESSGGALGVMNGAVCKCEDCHFISNLDGAASVNGNATFNNCEFLENRGYFSCICIGSHSVASSISLTDCIFNNNVGTTFQGDQYFLKGSQLSAWNCSFTSTNEGITFTGSGEYEITCGSICCVGHGLHEVARLVFLLLSSQILTTFRF